MSRQYAPYAVQDENTGGRTNPEADDALRSTLERDRHRVVESTAFRRLEHKTQVFISGAHDHFRTRLTHTLEVAQIARCLAVGLKANETLAETIALAHDLGHPPFGHAGEKVLNQAMQAVGGFNHNTHSLRVADYLEHPYPSFRGLNLTLAVREGLVKHATRYDVARGQKTAKGQETERYLSCFSTSDSSIRGPSVEAQIASLADRLAYNCHDLEDAIGAELIGADDLGSVKLWQNAMDSAAGRFGLHHIHAIRRVVLDDMIDELLRDTLATSSPVLKEIQSVDVVYQCSWPLVLLSDEMEARLSELEQFLFERVYRHPGVVVDDARGQAMIHELVEAYRRDPNKLPLRYRSRIDEQGVDRVICDYVAGMTDRYCQREYERFNLETRG